MLDDRLFRTAMGKFTTGVTIITAQVGEDVRGMTANAFMSVSLEPKLILVSVDRKATMNSYIEGSGEFAVSILNDQQQDMSAYFAGQINDERSINFEWFQGVPTVQGAIVRLICNVYTMTEAGDHILYVGQVKDLQVEDGDPLVFYGGEYRQVIDRIKAE
ncbi:Flavin reductase (NADH) [Lentibacillus sp. JNUCC-1]|uniref:flavin reductase family protein n=1 Tax=Lentibacillus sp. JNUCC-1 TaxID=2654513 RepID=UPI00132617CE|nr:Flavin reductase (NADH) [Lentibacillus sp. JNUCC-1]